MKKSIARPEKGIEKNMEKKQKQPFGLYAIIPAEDGLEPLKAILPNDGSRGFVVGEDWEIKFLHALLGEYLQTKKLSGEISDYNEQLGFRWITSKEAAVVAAQRGEIIPVRTIRWAAQNGFIRSAEKNGRDWYFPMVKFLYWVAHRPKPGRKKQLVDA